MSAETVASDARSAAVTPFSAGLVSSKTSGNLSCISTDPNQCALRRIKRLKKSVWSSGHLHGMVDRGMAAPQCWFVTLTYVGVDDWRPHHMADACRAFRRWCKAAKVPCRYTWVGELQNRGAVHYHLLAWLPKGVSMPQWDRPNGKRQAFWQHGMTNTEKAKSGVGYLMKYLSKLGEFHRFPKGMRLYGIGGLCKTGRCVRCWLNLPEWCKRGFGVGEVRRKSCGLVVSATGEILKSPFMVTVMSGYLSVRQLRPVAERFHHGCYSTFPRVTV